MTAIERSREHRLDESGSILVTRVVNRDFEAEMEAVYLIRREVFVREQGLTGTVYDEPDDRNSLHLVAQYGGKIIGTGRMTFVRDEAQIAWLAILPEYRRAGAGKALMEHMLSIAAEHDTEYVTLNAQTHALGFYEAFGFEPVGRRFHMSNIEHQYMVLALTRK
jgi:predicted GNAT family N-acyltransferase